MRTVMSDDNLWEAHRAHEACQWKRASMLWRDIAASRGGEGRGGALIRAACCQARDGDTDGAFMSLDEAVGLATYELETLATDEDLESLSCDPRWASVLASATERLVRWEQTLLEPRLR